MNNTDAFWVFAYGSLMSEPEAPASLLEQRPGQLHGFRRAFHQRSVSRGCPLHEPSVAPAVVEFCDEKIQWSLALGLAPEPDGVVFGALQAYPKQHATAVFRGLRRREGPGYEPWFEPVTTSGGTIWAWTFGSRLNHARVVDLPTKDVARILWAATPKRDIDGRARGVHYLLDVVEVLASHGVHDPNIDDLVERVQSTHPPGWSRSR